MDDAAFKVAEYDALAPYYDAFYSSTRRNDDQEFYEGLARETGGLVLELACGTGRLTVPLAASGLRITGLDASPKMLAAARQRLAGAPPAVQERCTLLLGDMREFRFSDRFGLIILAYSSLLELASETDRLATLSACRDHLAAGGCVAIDNFFYGTGAHACWGKQRPNHVVFFNGAYPEPTQPEKRFYRFESDVHVEAEGRTDKTIWLERYADDGTVSKEVLTVTRRYVSPEQMEAELRRAGFDKIEVYGGFGKEPLYAPSLAGRGRQLFVAGI